MKIPLSIGALALFTSCAGLVHAGLVTSDFLSVGDNLLVTDTNTSLEFLSPFYTRGHAFDDAFVQNVITTYGFAYADETTVLNMINANFGNPPLSPGDTTGFTDAQNFFNIFGINDPTTCSGAAAIPCPRTQGLTSTVSSTGTHNAEGMIQFDTVGWLIEQNPWSDSESGDLQMGSWLVRSASAGTPEPASFGLIALGLGAILGIRRRA
ncbi:MAG: PEP-CTERM sorting domain-containing protein [Acidobacteriia bacterium]|nr:PEP-CTERM sorting domain-containing protein [Terriglobia bacterium]